MSVNTIAWIHVFHIIGFVLWMGGLIACLQMLVSHASAPESARATLTKIEKKVALFMDVGALITIVAGLTLAFGQTYSPFKGAGWLHAKLTVVVVVVLTLHVFTRVQIRKFGEGHVRSLPAFMVPLAALIALGVIILPVVRPF